MLIFYPTFISIPTVLSTTQIINREYLSKDRKMSTANSGQNICWAQSTPHLAGVELDLRPAQYDFKLVSLRLVQRGNKGLYRRIGSFLRLA